MKKLIILISTLLFILAPVKTYAIEGNLSISCDNTKIAPGSTTTCRVSVSSDDFVTAVHSKITLGDGLSLESSTKESSWEGSSENGVIDVYTDADHGRNFVVTTFQVKASSSITNGQDTSISLNDSKMSGTDFKGTPVSSSPIQIRITSLVNNLKTLAVSGGNINFNPNTTSYNLTIDSAKVTISGTLEDNNAKVEGLGDKNLNYGSNTFKVIVTSESGSSKTYTLNITRPEPATPSTPSNKPSSGTTESKKSSDNKLSSLKVNDKEIELSTSTSYKLTVEYDTKEVDITYKTSNSKAQVKLEGDTKLKVGENTFKIIVTAEDGTTKTYNLTITRAPEGKKLSSNNYLKDLTVDTYPLNFNKNTEEYTVEIRGEKSLNIKATPEVTTSSVKVLDNDNLQNQSKIRIVVTAEDGTVREYVINVIKRPNYFLVAIIACLIILIVTLTIVVVNKRRKLK